MAYYFNLPASTELTRDQQLAVDETEPIALSGGPGTGKTVVNLWRHIFNYTNGTARSLLLTYTKTLEHYLRQSASSRNINASRNIDRTYRWTYGKNKSHYDEIIIDEAQDVEIDRYNIIKRHSDQCTYGADEAQSLYAEKSCSVQQLKQLFPNNEEYTLDVNFRNSQEILLFTKAVFPSVFIPQRTINNAEVTGIKPIVQTVGWDEDEIIANIEEIVKAYASDTHNIGILVPGKNQVTKLYNELESRINCSKYEGEMSEFESFENVHITTFKSAKGVEFDTVIIPNFDSYKWFIAKTHNIGMNDYYVALTRSKINLFLINKFDLDVNTNTYETE
ncbi:3'-5' exonuclease [Lutibacter flavus]|uniref:DNA 3'-5' helicase II n=1 Tax=Lutibacter flavus TaxID=691689 RepID=A0A238VHQ8_9FLAO|nr:3'-5' exonuclease [Lutibacter flavus]SNR33925.1 Uncharacterized conserved protein [Lutibacter flavus]